MKTAICCALTVLCGFALGDAFGNDIKGEVAWPGEWTVFAPFDRGHGVPDAEVFRSVRDSLTTPESDVAPARTAEARRIEVEPGVPVDLAEFFDEQRMGNVAYVFVEMESPDPQTATLGMGADWWLQAWVNGEEVFDTLDDGNRASPPTILNHTVDVALAEGTNVLAVRFITGLASSTLALGGPGEFAAAERREAERLAARELNLLPERFEDRLLFPVEEQALAMARRGMQLPGTDADLSRGDLAGLREMPERQVYFDREGASATLGRLLDTVARRFDDPVTIQLSKHRYPWEDRHLDAIVWTTPADAGRLPRGELEVVLKDAEGAALARHEIAELSPSGLFFSVGFPEALQGAEGSLEVVWRQGDNEVGRAEAPFRVEPLSDVARTGRVPLRILNEPDATVASAPMTVGVPFPRGALEDEGNVRLVDEDGAEIPLQTRVTAKWSRFGPVKWLLCDFTVDLDGGPRQVYLEYGPDIQRAERADIATGDLAAGVPALDAGRVRVDEDGLSFDAAGDGTFAPVLSPQAMLGAFVTREDGRTYIMPADAEYAFEELGSEKAVVRRTGWYAEPDTGDRFCQFVTRFVFHRDSPVVRVFHTWIFTGDGNADRIANMGWRFDAAQPMSDRGVLTAFENGEWLSGESLVQFDYQRFLLPDAGSEHEGRTPGMLSATAGGARVSFGTKDFWQNFPSEVEAGADGFAFYNWPKRNPPARFERPVAREDSFRNRFAHEGELLDFRIPDEYAEGEIWRQASGAGRAAHWDEGRPESANAQGIARTEEMFLYFADADTSADDAAKVIQGLNDETLRAVADPAWVAASGAFGDIHHHDPENYPEEERIFDLALAAPARWVERLGFYGMWQHGDYPTWSINLSDRTVSTYRTLRKSHQGYPYCWTPFARSGDPRLLKLAENAARQMSDANFCHYATAEVDESVGPERYRRQGFWTSPALFPWVGTLTTRSINDDCDYLWHAYYMTGYARARDVALLYGEATQYDHGVRSASRTNARGAQTVLTASLDMYEATFHPWFLSTAHAAADLHTHLFGGQETADKFAFRADFYGHTWRNALHRLYAFTGSDEHRHLALNNAVAWTSPHTGGTRWGGHGGGWGGGGSGLFSGTMAAFAWSLTDDDFYLSRVAASLDVIRTSVYEGETEYRIGSVRHIGHGYLPDNLPWGAMGSMLHALERAGRRPEPLHNAVLMSGASVPADEGFVHIQMPSLYVRKDTPETLPLRLDTVGRGRDGVFPEREYEPFSYEVLDRAGDTVLEGDWRAPYIAQIPADAREGVYRVNLSGVWDAAGEEGTRRFRVNHRRMFFPVAEPGTPEVFAFERTGDGTSVNAVGKGHYFKVPEGVEEFWIEFRDRTPSVNRVSVWNPDGERVYDRSYAYGDPPPRVAIEVPPEHAGRIWRATGGSFRIDPRIPPYFSASRQKWFNPEE